MEQIDKLANFIMKEIDGEPSQNEGAGDTDQDNQAATSRERPAANAARGCVGG